MMRLRSASLLPWSRRMPRRGTCSRQKRNMLPAEAARGYSGGYTRESGAGTRLLQGLQFLAGLKAHSLPGRNGHLGASARVAPRTGGAMLDREGAEATQLHTVAAARPVPRSTRMPISSCCITRWPSSSR